ncbi:MAG: hypothetical protein WAK42_07635 [Mycobacterium sp.]
MTVIDPRPHALALDLPRECTFDPADFAVLARYWYPIALTSPSGDLRLQSAHLRRRPG